MADRARTDLAHPAEQAPGTRFARTLLGYRRNLVDDAVTSMELRIDDLELQAVELREALLEAQDAASETKHDLTRARAELRYWNDRASYVDSEVARARQRAADLEQAARERAETIEADAQERSLQLIDRVCNEANAMLQAARQEAREMFLRFETDVDMSQQRLVKLEEVRTDVARTMQSALTQFEQAARELEAVAPGRRLADALEAPMRGGAAPSFGTAKALEAARRFEAAAEPAASAAMSTPVPTVLRAQVEDLAPSADVDMPEDIAGEPAPEVARVRHPADEAFNELLLQP